MKRSTYIAVLLIMSAVFLTSLVPGGLVETRDFSHIHPLILISFNLFLTVLVLASLILGIQWFRQFGHVMATLTAGVSYFLVYTLDLLAIFPVSSTPMSEALWAIEVSGLVLAIPLVVLSIYQLVWVDSLSDRGHFEVPWRVVLPIGLVVVIYASMVTICGKQ